MTCGEGMILRVARFVPLFGDPYATKIIIPVSATKPRLKDSATRNMQAS